MQGVTDTLAQQITLNAVPPLAHLADDGGAFTSFVMSDYEGTSERSKIVHILWNAEVYCPYTSLLLECSDHTTVSTANVLCAHTRPLVHREAWDIRQLKIVITYRYDSSAPLWFTVSVQRDHHPEPRHATDRADAVLTHAPAHDPAGDTPTSAQTHTLTWHHGGSNWDALWGPLEEGDRICVWAHTE